MMKMLGTMKQANSLEYLVNMLFTLNVISERHVMLGSAQQSFEYMDQKARPRTIYLIKGERGFRLHPKKPGPRK